MASKAQIANTKTDKAAETARTTGDKQDATGDLALSMVESPSKTILRMQQTRGNAFVLRMLDAGSQFLDSPGGGILVGGRLG